MNTGVKELTEKQLADLFDKEPKKFFKFIDRKHAMYTSDLDYYKVEKVADVDDIGCKIDEIVQLICSINCIRRFIQGAIGIVEDEDEKKLLERRPLFSEVADKYAAVYASFKSKNNQLRAGETVAEETVAGETGAVADESVRLKQYSLEGGSDEGSKDAAEKVAADMNRKKGYDGLLPMAYDVTSFHQETTAAAADNSSILLDQEIEQEVRAKSLASNMSAATAMNAASTPLAARMNIRFSETVNHHTISKDESQIRHNPISSVVNGVYMRSLSPSRAGTSASASVSAARPSSAEAGDDITRLEGDRRDRNSRAYTANNTADPRSSRNDLHQTHRTAEDFTVRVLPEDSWRYCAPKSNKIEELSLCEDLAAISGIIEVKVTENMSDVELMALEARDVVELKQLKKNIERKVVALPRDLNPQLESEATRAFLAATRWMDTVRYFVHAKQLHIQSDLKYSKPIELEPFKGHTNSDTNCYEFFTAYELIARKYTDRDKAAFLFANYLAENIQCEVKHLNTSYRAMKECIIARHGNVNTLLMHKKNKIRNLKMIYYKSPRAEKLTYIKTYIEVLEQLCSLIELNTKEYPAIRNELLSYVSVMELCKLLPEYIFNMFNSNYTKDAARKGVHALTGEESFVILQRILKQLLGELELQEELFFDAEEKSIKDSRASRGLKKGVLSVGQVRGERDRRPFSSDEYWGAPCIGHPDSKYRLKECLSGQCTDFLEMKPKDRERSALEKNVCLLCLLFGCRLRGDGKCLFINALPKNVICKGCQLEGVEKNVLLCGKHKNDTPEIQSAVRSFLPGCGDNTVVELYFLGSVFNFEMDRVDESGCYRTCADAFDINSGRRVPMQDVEFKTQKDHGSFAVYPTQTINIGGIPVTVLWDTGAIGELVKEDIAEKLNLTILEAKSQSFSVAGAQTVRTNCPLYQLTLGPNDRDEFHQFPLLGVRRISETLPEVDLGPVVARIKKELVDFPESKGTFPPRCGGAEIEMILGTRLSHLFPTRIYVLRDGLQIWRSPLKDIYGSNLLISGPIEPIKNSINLVSVLHSAYHGLIPETVDVLTPIDHLMFKDRSEEQLLCDGLGCTSDSFPMLNSDDHTSGSLLCDDLGSTSDSFPMLNSDDHIIGPLLCDDLGSTSDSFPMLNSGDHMGRSLFLSEQNSCGNSLSCYVLEDSECAVRILSSIMRKKAIPRTLEQTYRDEEEAGSVVDYRCSDCYPCKACLQSGKIRNQSIKETAEEVLIWDCVKVDSEKCVTTCDYPFTTDPETYLTRKWGGMKNNFKMAERTLNTQRAKSEESRSNVVKFNQELYSKGFVSPVSELSPELQKLISDATFVHYFCWRSVSNQNSLTTSTRMVADPTISHFNDVVAKGVNSLTSLYQLILAGGAIYSPFVATSAKCSIHSG